GPLPALCLGRAGDYAYLLHIIRSMKGAGKGACILPHGVLFRGNAEATIREQLVRSGYIEGIIGLPPNLFYGTGIPACIVVLDKENAQTRTGSFIGVYEGWTQESPAQSGHTQDRRCLQQADRGRPVLPDGADGRDCRTEERLQPQHSPLR